MLSQKKTGIFFFVSMAMTTPALKVRLLRQEWIAYTKLTCYQNRFHEDLL